MTTFVELIQSEATAHLLADRFVAALRRVYILNAERHEEAIGDDRLTFGVQVWRNSWFALEEELTDLDLVRTSRPNGSLAIHIGRAILHPYKVGATEELNIETVRIAGTLTKDRIAASNQMTLFEEESPSGSASEPAHLVLAHSGNPFDGLCGIWVGAPTLTDDGPAWLWVEQIYRIPPEEVRRTEEPGPEPSFPPYTEMPLSEIDLSLLPQPEEQPQEEE